MLYNSNLLILGDFNIPEFQDCYCHLKNPTDIYNTTCQFASFFDIKQYNHILNENNRLLDLVYTNLNCRVVSIEKTGETSPSLIS